MHQKLSKAQSLVGGTRAQAPTLKDGKEQTKVCTMIFLLRSHTDLFVQEEKEKKKEENQLTKSVRDRWDQIRPECTMKLTNP